MYRKNFTLLMALASIFLAYFTSCEKKEIIKNPSARLDFSTDTVMFDTVFTTIGSTTKRFAVKNPYDKSLDIQSIRLAGGHNSDFRLNINGTQTREMSNIKLDASDSLFIFVEVTVDPNHANSPMVIKDSVVFNTNGNIQDIKLVAWGQDVNLINGEVLKTQTWTSEKPYLVYNSALVDTQNTLTIEPGTRIHFHRNSRFYVAGSLISDGTKEEPIVFTSDRLESGYSNIPGQWDGIWLMPGSHSNVMDHTHIKNAILGVQVDTLGNTASPTLTLSNSKIEHMTFAGIYAQGTYIKAYNTVISDCGDYAVALTLGGSYEFYHCTIANYWGGSTRNTPSLLLNNYYIDINDKIQIRDLEKALFKNCIIYGNNPNEIGFDSIPSESMPSSAMNYQFEHCLIKSKSIELSEKNLKNKDPRFVSMSEYDFRLDTLSPAIDQGDIQTGERYPTDILNNSRISDEAPDLGAYEFIPETSQKNP